MEENREKNSKLDIKNDPKMTRRAFLGNAGKLVGLGVLAHFTLIGKAYADITASQLKQNSTTDDISRIKCSAIQTNSCEGTKYTCSTASEHSCKNRFSCGTFSCLPNSANNCTTTVNNCNPVSTFSQPE